MVADGMSAGTLTCADHFSQILRKRGLTWMQLYNRPGTESGLMNMRSLNSLVTDSSAASSSWGSGSRIVNGTVNILPDGAGLGGGHVLFQTGHIGPHLFGNRKGLRLADLTARAEELRVELPIFVTIGLIEHGNRDFRRLDRSAFLAEYGHLRPGTYDILSPRYDEAPDLYFDWSAPRPPEAAEKDRFALSLGQMRGIERHHAVVNRRIDDQPIFNDEGRLARVEEARRRTHAAEISGARKARWRRPPAQDAGAQGARCRGRADCRHGRRWSGWASSTGRRKW